MAFALVSVASQSAMSGEEKTRNEADLSSTSADPLASGEAKSESRGSRLKLTIEVEDIASVGAGGTLNAFINGASVGSMTVDALGTAKIDIDTDEGDTVPGPYGDGDVVEIRLAGGTVILAGSF